MAPRTDLQIWADLECTGPEDDDDIIEIGLVLVETERYMEVSSFTTLVAPRPDSWRRMLRHPVVSKMHTENGLMEAINDDWNHLPGRAEVDEQIVNWIKFYVGKDTTHIPLGGSGFCHFDRKYVKRDLPRFDKRITHWTLDSGGLERTFALAGVPWLREPTDKSHRALDDARFHLREFKFALDTLRRGQNARTLVRLYNSGDMQPGDMFYDADNGERIEVLVD